MVMRGQMRKCEVGVLCKNRNPQKQEYSVGLFRVEYNKIRVDGRVF